MCFHHIFFFLNLMDIKENLVDLESKEKKKEE